MRELSPNTTCRYYKTHAMTVSASYLFDFKRLRQNPLLPQRLKGATVRSSWKRAAVQTDLTAGARRGRLINQLESHSCGLGLKLLLRRVGLEGRKRRDYLKRSLC